MSLAEVSRHSSFAPVVNDATRVIILGSLPGQASLAAREYYAHPQNHFWRLIGKVIGRPLIELAYPARLETLLAAGIGLWDVIHSARRLGSLDSAISDAKPNALGALLATLPNLRAIAFNGSAAARIGKATLRGSAKSEQCNTTPLLALPSSSPAHARMSFEQKSIGWQILAQYLVL